MWSFWRTRERFSMEELKYLSDQLQRVTIVNESNKDHVIEILRSMAEVLIWGDQHDPSFFEFFMEKQLMTDFTRILKKSRISSVAVQVLQTLNIMVQNMRSEQAIYYLFSNEHINNVITFPFDFRNEELVAYYISFLRTISTKLDKNTISFFVKTQNDIVVSFPLYMEAIKFAHHEESMVRIAVRTLTLNIYHVQDASIQKFILSAPVANYFSELIAFLKQQTFSLVDLVNQAARKPDSLQTVSRLEEAIAELGDLIYYCNDIINAGVPDLSRLMTKHVMELLVVPVLIPSLSPVEATGPQNSELSSLYLLSCLLQVVNYKDLVNGIGFQLLQKASYKDEKNSSLGQESKNLPNENHETGPNRSSRELLLSYLFCDNDKLVLASLSVLVALLQNKALDETLLDALGILPQRKRYKKLLLQALVGNKTDEEVLFSSPSSTQGDDLMEISSMNALNLILADQEGSDFRSCGDEARCDCDESALSMELGDSKDENNMLQSNFRMSNDQFNSRRNRYQVLDALMRLLCRNPPPCAEALWHTGWLLRQLLPYHEQKLRDHHIRMLDEAHLAAQEDLVKEVRDCWCDIIPNVLVEEWKICKKALETPALQKDSSFVLLPESPDTSSKDDSSLLAGERMRANIKVFVILHQLRTLVLDGSIPDSPPLQQPRETVAVIRTGRIGVQLTAVKRDTEIDLTPGDAIPCRIAFERGKERAVYLLVFSKGISGWLILAEDIPMKPSHGIIRVIAPLAGSNPRIDQDHPKWLHLRIRTPHYPSSDVSRIGSSSRSRMKRLVDGRWTLAFQDELTCRHANTAVLEEMDIQSSAVKSVLEPLLHSTVVSDSSQKSS